MVQGIGGVFLGGLGIFFGHLDITRAPVAGHVVL